MPHPQTCKFSPGGLDFTQPVYCTVDKIKTIRAIAANKRFTIKRVTLSGALYKLTFRLAGNQPTIPFATNTNGPRMPDNNSELAQDEPGQAAGNCYTPQIRMRLA